MKLSNFILISLILAFGVNVSFAGSMRCGTDLIESGSGLTKQEVEDKCGSPESTEGNNMYYKKNNVRYILHFDESGQLAEVSSDIN